ncbi:MAG: DUF4350 domain-containing protein [Promethearchaeota archaeon]
MTSKFKVTLVIFVFLSSIFFSAAFAGVTQDAADETALRVNIEDSFLPAQFARRTIRVAVYSESNTTIPDWAVAYHLSDYSSNVVDLLNLAGFDATPLTTQDILDRKLMTADYDVFVMVNNLPRESIYNHVKEFWLGGGGILSYGSAMEYLHNSGMLVPEWEGESGFTDFVTYTPPNPTWANYTFQNVSIIERMPVTQDYDAGETIATEMITSTIINVNIIAPARGSSYHALASVYLSSANSLAAALDNPDRGGRIVQLPGNGSEFLTWESDLTIRAVDWICPHPKGRILFDISHEPRLGIDPWDNVMYPGYYAESRDFLVNHTYTFDKLYETDYSAEILEKYDMLIILSPDVNLTAADRTVIQNWVTAGGGLLALGERPFGSFDDPVDQINQIVEPFGLNVTEDNGYEGAIDTGTFDIHPTTEGVASIYVDYAAYLGTTGAAYPIWYDQAGTNIFMAGANPGAGRVILTGDINWCQSDHLQNDNNIQYWLGIANWLTAGNVLIFSDEVEWHPDLYYNEFKGSATSALNDLGLRYQFTHEPLYLNISLYLNDWDLVIVDNSGFYMVTYYDDLLTYMEGGGRLILTTWTYDEYWPLYDYLGFQYGGNLYTAPPVIYAWDDTSSLWNLPVDYGADNLTTTQDEVWTDCANLTLHANGTAYAGLTPVASGTNASVIVGAEGRAITNGMLLSMYFDDTDDSLYPDAFEIWENEIAFLIDHPSLNQPSDIEYQEGDTGNSILWSTSGGIPWIYVIKQDGSTVQAGRWTGGPVTINVDGLSPAIYEYTITLQDRGGYEATYTVLVTVTAASTTTTSTTTTTNTTTGFPLDTTTLIIIVAAAGGLIIIIIIVMMKKKGE